MADNFQVNVPSSSGDTFAADDIAGIKHQRVKVQHGADGSATDVSSASPMPVTDALGATEVTLSALNTKVTAVNTGAVVVSSSALPSGAATSAKQDDQTTALQLIDDIINTLGAAITAKGALIAGSDGTNARAIKVDAAGELQVDVLTMPTVAVTGPLTDAQLRATPVPVSGTVTASGPLTDAQLRATAVPVSLASVPSHAVTNAGTFAVQESGAALTALQLIDDAVKTDDAAFTPATDKVLMVGAEFDDTTPDSVNEGDAGAIRMSANRNLYTTLRDAAGNERGVNVTAGNALTVDGSGTTQPVSAASLPLPSGAATSAKQDTMITSLQLIDDTIADPSLAIPARAVQVSGSDGVNAQVLAVNSAGQVSVSTVSSVSPGSGGGNLGKAEDAAHASGNTGVFVLGIRSDTRGAAGMIAGTDGDYIGFQMNASGDLRVDGSAVTQPVSAASLPLPSGAATETTLADIKTAAQLIDDAVYSDDAAFTPATSKIIAVGLQADETSPDSVNEGDIGAPRMTLDRMAIVTVRPNATGEGLDIFRSIDVDETEEEIKASAGKLYGWFLYNAASAVRFIKFYNATAASVSVGTTTPILTIPLAAGAAANVEFTNGIPFSTALCIAATTAVADSDTGAPGANEIIANIFYK